MAYFRANKEVTRAVRQVVNKPTCHLEQEVGLIIVMEQTVCDFCSPFFVLHKHVWLTWKSVYNLSDLVSCPSRNVIFPDLSDEFNVIITDRSVGQNHENWTQVVINLNYPLTPGLKLILVLLLAISPTPTVTGVEERTGEGLKLNLTDKQDS